MVGEPVQQRGADALAPVLGQDPQVGMLVRRLVEAAFGSAPDRLLAESLAIAIATRMAGGSEAGRAAWPASGPAA